MILTNSIFCLKFYNTFVLDIELNGRRLYLALQYNFGEDGEEYEPMCLYKRNYKLNAEYLHNALEQDLDEIIGFIFPQK